MANNKTISLASLFKWGELCRDPAHATTAVDAMVKHITIMTKRQSSLMPRMLLTACSLGESKFRRSRLLATRSQRCFRSLREFYRAERHPKQISPQIENRLLAFATFATENRILNIRRQPRLFIVGSNGLRVSLPACYIARMNGKRIMIALHYEDDLPLDDGKGLTDVGKTVVGGLCQIFDRDKIEGARRELFIVPAYIDELLVLDIAKVTKTRKHRTIRLRAGDLFLNGYKLDFAARHSAVTALYADACKLLGIEHGDRGKEIDTSKEEKTGELFKPGRAKKA